MRSFCTGSLVVLMLMAGSAGCGGGGDETSTGTSPGSSEEASSQESLTELDACTLLTAGEIESATGYAPGAGSDPVKNVSAAAPICAWPSKDGSVHQVAQVLVTWSSARSFEEYREMMAKEGVTGLRQVDGPGRFTVLLEDMNMVQAFGERYMVQTMVEVTEGKDRVTAGTTLATAALGRIE